MKCKLLASLMVLMLFTSVVPLSAGSGINDLSTDSSTSETAATESPVKADGKSGNGFEATSSVRQDGSSEETGRNSGRDEDGWSFNETSEWSGYAYADGNRTRLIVGVDVEKADSLPGLEQIIEEQGAEVASEITIGGQVRAVVVELYFASVTTLVEEVRNTGLASYVEPNMKFQTQLVPNDPYWSLQWGPRKIEADLAWNTTSGDPSVIVAVVDTGIDYTHPDIAANYAALGYDWANGDPYPMDDYGHGTHCAGIIAAVLNNSEGIAGLAQVSVMAEKVLDSYGWGYEDWVASGIIHAADSGADVISMSIGSYGWGELLHDAVKYAYDSGVLLVAAAGNDGTSMKLYPAGYDEVVAVAATDQYDLRTSWSNWGDWIELAAPGDYIYSTVPGSYAYASGTSMACPHVSGVAALVRSLHPYKTRDWVRMWLEYAADDLGEEGFDPYYGYGRVNARNAIEEAPPVHELIAYEWTTPPYLEAGDVGNVTVTVLNFGQSDETDIDVQLLVNSSIVDSKSIGLLATSSSTKVALTWNPTVEGSYNVTLYVVPAPGETNLENNVLSRRICVGTPVKAVVLHSSGNILSEIIINWRVFNNEWRMFGDTMVYIDYSTLNKDDITYSDIAATEADVLIISCAYDPSIGWEFSDSEIEAIERYVYEGHGLIATAGTLYYWVPNNNKLAHLFGLSETVTWDATWTDLLHIIDPTHPMFAGVPDPFVFPDTGTSIPSDWRWDSNELTGGEYLALGHYEESAIATFKGLVYIAPWLESVPPYYHHHLQLIYNAIIWSRYRKPEHELVVSLEHPTHLQPGETALLNATVCNLGMNNETSVELFLLINGATVNSSVISNLPTGSCYTISYTWTPVEAVYNITAYSPVLLGEEFTSNNVDSARLYVRTLRFVLWDDAHDADGDSLTGNYLNLNELLNGNGFVVDELTEGMISDALLTQYDILVLMDPELDYSTSEIEDIQSWVATGGGLIVIPDGGCPSTINTLMDPFGVHETGRGAGYGVTTDIVSHPVTEEVREIYVDWVREISVASPSECLAWVTEYGERCAFLSALEGGGVAVASDSNIMDNDRLGMSDNTQLMLNMFNWVAVKPEHDLAVTLNSPRFLEPHTSVLLNATVCNRGLNNETDVELELWIDSEKAAQVTVPVLVPGNCCTVSHLWSPAVEGVYNLTAFTPPVAHEEYIGNNLDSLNVKVRYTIARVAVLNSWNVPPYFTGGWDNNYQPLVDTLNAQGFYAEAVTNEEIIEGALRFFDVFVMIDNVPSEAAVPHVVDFWSSGGGLVAFDSSICFLCYAGVLPPKSYGSNGYSVYWDYDTTHEARISIAHPVTEGYEVGQIVHGASGDAEYRVDALAGTSVLPHYSMLVEDLTRPDRAYVSAYEPITAGKAVHIWDYSHWINLDLQLMILNAMEWAAPLRYEHDLAVSLIAPEFLESGDSTILNATVANRGLNNETDVRLHLLIDGIEVDNKTIGTLSVGESEMVSYTWTETIQGTHNVTAWATPLVDEENLENNMATKLSYVFFYSRLYLPHEWVGSGIPTGWHADDESWSYELLFDFPFYGKLHRTLYISSNGLITFDAPDSSYYNSIAGLAEKFAIAPAWDDWVTDDGDIYIWQNTSHVGIRWYVRALYDSSITANFETILDVEGGIRFNYASNNGSISATIGISNGAGHIIAQDVASIDYFNTVIFTQKERDVAICDVQSSPCKVCVGETVEIDVTVANEGEIPEMVTVRVYYENGTGSLNSTSLVMSVPSEPHPADAIWIEPSFIDLTNYTVGQRFRVTAWINLSLVSFAWQIDLVYHKSVLGATDCSYTAGATSEFFEGLTTIPLSPAYRDVNSTHADVFFGEALMTPAEKEPGYGSLCWIEFELVNRPPGPYEGRLVLDSEDTYALDPELDEILPSLYHGVYGFGVSPPPPPPPPPLPLIGQLAVDLPPLSNKTVSFAWNTSGLAVGNYTVVALVDVLDGETDVEDNVFVNGAVEVLWIHDVAVIDVSSSSTWVYESWPVAFNVTAKNKGDFTENVTITLYYNETDGSIIDTTKIENLLPGKNGTVTLVWDTTGVEPCRNYTITAVARIDDIDYALADNTLVNGRIKVRILGDIDGDGKVDMKDIGGLALAFGSFRGHVRWDPDADLDNNGKIDIRDVALGASNFGRCP